jgi:hypothetical protein
MVEGTRAGSRPFVLGALLCAAAGLAGCDAAMTSVAQSSSESAYRAEAARLDAQGNPSFSDPKLQAVVRAFEADYARFGLEAEALQADAGGTCPVSPEGAYRLLFGTDYAEQQRAYAEHGVTSVTDLDSLEVRTISGTCDAAGIEGPAEIVGSSRTVARYGQGDLARVTVTDTVRRLRARWVGGERVGPVRDISVSRVATFEPGSDGALEAQDRDWDFLDEMSEAPTAVYTYTAMGPGHEQEPHVSFMRNPVLALSGVNVTERRADGTGYLRSYAGSELRMEASLKDGKVHGWQITHPTTWQGTAVAGSRTCYQHGEAIKSTTCPTD